MTGLPDPAASRAVVIGSAAYRHLAALPAVEANVKDLAAELCDATVWGLPEQHCTLVLDPQHPAELLDPVNRAGEEATDTLLVYYAGHGMRDAATADLYLALQGSREHVGYTAVAYQHLRSACATPGPGARWSSSTAASAAGPPPPSRGSGTRSPHRPPWRARTSSPRPRATGSHWPPTANGTPRSPANC
ncbi:hypothetical protein [Streptomyces sp. NPDC041003]|uniref:caspase family protein n=1 Tax=Streptomyces sp. NPDC041003 TaxID=3155730 RepID=UPI0033DC8121